MSKGHLFLRWPFFVWKNLVIHICKKILILFGNDIGTFYICIRFIIVMNNFEKKGNL